MAFGVSKEELARWKAAVARQEIAFLTHYWYDPRFPEYNSVTKAGCSDLERLEQWCASHGLNPRYIHRRQPYPHFDLIGSKQREVLRKEQQWEQLTRFKLL
ncbi:hypothetical protein [Paenibacillus sp. SYP-B4298]|uniref:hypothetical protein n=1 Tax=Paenibacillus sp. SYP-B4298 TaxID=2996034 RepID=UPI0022DCEE1F|nr:hypothetical protein [Paenibacillus sp. SYP-B4298]